MKLEHNGWKMIKPGFIKKNSVRLIFVKKPGVSYTVPARTSPRLSQKMTLKDFLVV